MLEDNMDTYGGESGAAILETGSDFRQPFVFIVMVLVQRQIKLVYLEEQVTSSRT